MPTRSIWPTSCAAGIFLLASGVSTFALAQAATPSTIRPDDELLALAAKGIKSQEDAIQNITIHATRSATQWNAQRRAMEPNGETSLTAQYDGLPAGMCKIDVHRMVNRWFNGASPFALEIFSIAFNGRVGEYYRSQSGPAESPNHVSDGNIGGNSGASWTQALAYDSGWDMSIFGVTRTLMSEKIPIRRFSAILAGPTKKEGKLSARPIAGLNKEPYVEITFVGAFGEQIWWLDPARNYAMVQGEQHRWTMVGKDEAGNPKLAVSPEIASKWHVDEFHSLGSGVFYPKTITAQGFSKKDRAGGPTEENLLEFSRVTINDPAVTKDSYLLSFPEGASIHEGDNPAFIVAGPPDAQQKMIDQAVQRAEEAAATAPAISQP